MNNILAPLLGRQHLHSMILSLFSGIFLNVMCSPNHLMLHLQRKDKLKYV